MTTWDHNGNTATRAVSYTVTPPPPQLLSVTSFRLCPGWWVFAPIVEVSGRLTLPIGSSSACRDVTVSISSTSMQQTVKASSFRSWSGLCIYVSPRAGSVRSLVVDPRSGRWCLSGGVGKHDLRTLGSVTTIRFRFGVTDATVTVPLVRDRFGVVSLRR